jgi:hypothetical protein
VSLEPPDYRRQEAGVEEDTASEHDLRDPGVVGNLAYDLR